MGSKKQVDKLKVIEGYREPSSTSFDAATNSIDKIEVEPGTEAKIVFGSKVRYYPWHRVLNYEER